MIKPLVILVDDQREVLQALQRDLADFDGPCELLSCESADEAWEEVDQAANRGQAAAVMLCDQMMPGRTGVELMKQIRADDRFNQLRMAMVTGQATHTDTIEAINQAQLDGYIAKPWKQPEVIALVSRLLTRHLLATGADIDPFKRLLDQEILLQAMRRDGADS